MFGQRTNRYLAGKKERRMLEITGENFEKEVLNSDKPVLIDFWAPWCMPCKIIAPTVEKLASELREKVKVSKANVDENPDIANRLSVMNIPTLVLFKGGQEVSRMIGVNSKESIEAKIGQFVD
jgi:thioredoxin 1